MMMMMMMDVLRILSLMLLLVMDLGKAAASWDKCGACQAVAAELEIGLLNERPRNHLDMRHRLDSKGQREGKLIDYKVSDLRVSELLDDLCTKMKAYTLEMSGPGKGRWTKIQSPDSSYDMREADAYSKQITTYCGRLLEDTEEELEVRIKKGSMNVGEVESILCWELAQHCKFPRSKHEEGEMTMRDDEL